MFLTVGGACPGLAESNPGLQKLVAGAFGLPLGNYSSTFIHVHM
jgi:hypothetical protein